MYCIITKQAQNKHLYQSFIKIQLLSVAVFKRRNIIKIIIQNYKKLILLQNLFEAFNLI